MDSDLHSLYSESPKNQAHMFWTPHKLRCMRKDGFMNNTLILSAGKSLCHSYACEFLARRGYSLINHPAPEVSHVLFDVPTKEDINPIMERIPEAALAIGGFLAPEKCESYRILNLLADEYYLSANALITAQCAVKIGFSQLPGTYYHKKVLILGHGRIGKHLVNILSALGAEVTIAERSLKSCGFLSSMNIAAISLPLQRSLSTDYSIIFNTIPLSVIDESKLPSNTVLIDLASRPGLNSAQTIRALGLPGKLEPRETGLLLANRIHSILKENET